MTRSRLSRPFKEDKLPYLYFIANRKLYHPTPLEEVISKVLDAGICFIQLREKDLNPYDLYVLAKKIKDLTVKYGAYLLINEKVDIAMAIDAEGVHLPESSLPVAETRKLLGDKKLIGKSIHLPISLNDKDFTYIDFVTLSPIFSPGGKNYQPNIVGIDQLESVISNIPVPVYGLGGIKPTHVSGLINKGVYGIAVSSGIAKVSGIKKRAEEYLKKFEILKTE